MNALTASTAHPLATQAALRIADAGGNAVDAAIAAQAVICAVLPQSAGLGGDGLDLVDTGETVQAINGTGLSPAAWDEPDMLKVGNHVTVPGIVGSWFKLHAQHGRVPMPDLLAPAIRACRDGITVDERLMNSIDSQRDRLAAVSPDDPLLRLTTGDAWQQKALADLLENIGESGPDAFYRGPCAEAIARSVHRHEGALSVSDLAAHRIETPDPIRVAWDGGTVMVQPPSSQGVLLAAGLSWFDQHLADLSPDEIDHAMVETTGVVFGWRDDRSLGEELLERPVAFNLDRATPRIGPRAYLHTAGVATADAEGMVVSSLISVFDDFGSGIWVPETGLRLNNRACGFTAGRNAARAAARPVHTLAPSIVHSESGGRYALATPGADGQVQTLLQVLVAHRRGTAMQAAIDQPRWRSQDGELVIPSDHPAIEDLRARKHRLRLFPSEADLYGAVVCAGVWEEELFAVADWRRQTTAGSFVRASAA